jgi:hypothetical protein
MILSLIGRAIKRAWRNLKKIGRLPVSLAALFIGTAYVSFDLLVVRGGDITKFDQSLLPGALIAILIELIALEYKVKYVPSLQNIGEFVESFWTGIGNTSLDNYLGVLLLSDVQNAVLAIKHKTYEDMSPGRVPNFWVGVISHFGTSLLAVSYVNPSTWQDKFASETALGIQKMKRDRAGCRIKRVFVWRRHEELAFIKEAIEAQKKYIEVKLIQFDEIVKSHQPALRDAMQTCIEEVGTLDFAIVDGRYVASIYLRKRMIRGAGLTGSENSVRAATEFYELLFDAAVHPDHFDFSTGTRVTIQQLQPAQQPTVLWPQK